MPIAFPDHLPAASAVSQSAEAQRTAIHYLAYVHRPPDYIDLRQPPARSFLRARKLLAKTNSLPLCSGTLR